MNPSSMVPGVAHAAMPCVPSLSAELITEWHVDITRPGFHTLCIPHGSGIQGIERLAEQWFPFSISAIVAATSIESSTIRCMQSIIRCNGNFYNDEQLERLFFEADLFDLLWIAETAALHETDWYPTLIKIIHLLSVHERMPILSVRYH